MMQKRLLLILFAILSLAAPAVQAQDKPKELKIIRVTPEGDDVPAGRQIVIEFNRPVVAVGRMERTAEEVGIAISPNLDCRWRWLNTSALGCNLDDESAMRQATKYIVEISPVLRAEDGARIAQPYTHSFITQRPSVSYTSFQTWLAPAHPVIRITFTQPVTGKSVAEHLYFITGEATRHRIAVKADGNYHEEVVLTPDGEARRAWLIEPQDELPVQTNVRLIEDAGLVSAEGIERGAGKPDPVLEFDTFPPLRFLGLRCFNSGGMEMLIAPGEVQTEERLCNPQGSFALAFSAPVMRSQIKEKASFTPDLANGRKDFNPWGEENRDYSMLGDAYRAGKVYYIGLPVWLKAAQEYTLEIPGAEKTSFLEKIIQKKRTALEDQFGRMLDASVSMKFSTAHRNPNYLMTSNSAVLEKDVDSEVPLYVNNIKTIAADYRSVTIDGAEEGQSKTIHVPQVMDVQFAVPLGLRDMLKSKSGALYASITSDPAVYRDPEHIPHLYAQVTPYHVHFKLGHFESLAWVTDLATGRPVTDANVTVYEDSFDELGYPGEVLAQAITDKNGTAVLPGIDVLDPHQLYVRSWRGSDPLLFVRVEKDSDMALLPLNYDFAINTWNLSSEYIPEYNREKNGHILSWGMTAQGIYRAGDAMQYKIFVRNQSNKTLIPPPQADYTLEIIDPAGKTAASIRDVRLSQFGSFAGEYLVPKTAAIGWYQFRLTADFGGEKRINSDGEEVPNRTVLEPMRVLVSDFTPAPFNVSASINGDHFRADDAIEIEAMAKLHSGGAYADAAVRATVTLRSRYFDPGTEIAKGFSFDSFTGEKGSEQLYQEVATLDDKGEWKGKFKLPRQDIVYGVLEVEGAVQDDRGKNIAALAYAGYAGVDRLVGLKSENWMFEAGKPVTVETLVVDDRGEAVPGVTVDVDIERQVVSTVKVKGAGNAYLSDTTIEWQKAGACKHKSGNVPVKCNFTTEKPGTYRYIAAIKDSKGAIHKTQLDIWVTGKDYVQWDDHSEMALPIMPEKREYNVGDTARYLVKNPYPGAQALITIERFGVIDTIVKTLEGSTPVIEFPVKPDYLPGFYLSVLVVSPRVEKPLGEGQVDLGKPAFRMGYVSVPVRDRHKEMMVSVKTEDDVYRPRDIIKVDIEAKPRFSTEKKEPVELAVAVLDEAVFDLVAGGRDAFDPYKGFYNLEALDMRNYSLMTRLIGRQKFEKKGTNPGGDGGADLDMRNIFKYVSYWNHAVPVDENGKAHIEFEAPDNLTGWRVLALAVTPGDRMGLGDGAFKVNRPTELRPVMPNQVREGDSFMAGFSVMNRTDSARTIDVTIGAEGDIEGEKPQRVVKTVALEAYKRTTVYLPLKAALLPAERELAEGTMTFRATAGDALDSDGMEHSLPVNKFRVFDVAASYATTTDNKATENVEFPDGIYTDTGDVSVVAAPSVIGNVTGAFRYLRDYSYTCWEQRVTRAVMAMHYKNLKSYMPGDFIWKDSDKAAQDILDDAATFQAPNGGMAYFTGQDDYADPYLSAYTALAFRWLAKGGFKISAQVEEKLHVYLQTFLRQDIAPDFYQPGMKSTVRAVALAALADAGKIGKSDLARYEPHLKEMSLFGKAHFMQAANFLGDMELSHKAASMILSAGSETGGKLVFNEVYDDGYDRILGTPERDNCAVLNTLLSYHDENFTNDKAFKMVRAITQSRGSRYHWENTQENVFCMSALANYASVYETDHPDMNLEVFFDKNQAGEAVFKSFSDEPATFTKPIEKDDPGRKAVVTVNRNGDGRLYYATRLRYASKSHPDSVDAGMDMRREYSVRGKNGEWTILDDKAELKRGDIVRVDLFLSVPTARNFVVVNDPVPGGLEPVNRDLATASSVDAESGKFTAAGGSFWFKFDDWREYNVSRWSFYHQELRYDSVRFYADWLPPGNYHLSYTAQAVAEGDFSVPPVRAEEMYDPDVYGTGSNATISVKARE